MATDAAAEVNKIQALEERIKAPSVWGRVHIGLRFEDLQDKRYDEAARFLKKHYLNEDICYRSVRIADDKEGTDEFIHNARIWMKDKMSIAVIKESTDKLVGLLIMRIQERNGFSRTFSRVKLTYNPLYTAVMKYFNAVEKPVDMFYQLNVRRYLKIYVWALKPRYRHRGVGKELLKSTMGLAASAFVPALAGIFTSGRGQAIATEMGFKKYNEIYYIRYKVDDKIVFWDIGHGNYGAAFMGYRIPDIEEPENALAAVQSSRLALQKDEEASKLSQKAKSNQAVETADAKNEQDENAEGDENRDDD